MMIKPRNSHSMKMNFHLIRKFFKKELIIKSSYQALKFISQVGKNKYFKNNLI